MWLWDLELQRIGIRRKSRRYWQGEGRFGLPAGAYVSMFVTARDNAPGRRRRGGSILLEVSAFHVTFLLNADNIHFYYHEVGEGVWAPGGHTSVAEIARHGTDARVLRDIADAVAAEVVAALGGILRKRCRRYHDGKRPAPP
jgi:hypothetical protein